MLRTSITYKDVFPCLKQREKLYTSMSSKEEWNTAKEIHGRLKLFIIQQRCSQDKIIPLRILFFLFLLKYVRLKKYYMISLFA